MSKTPVFLTMLLAMAAFAVNNVAVLELVPNSSIEDEISIGEFRHLTDELRRQAVMTLPKDEYSVLTRDNLLSLMPPDEKEAECLAESCAIEIGRAIGAEYISQGTIGKFGKKLTISVELYETMSGKLLSSIVFESENIDGLLGVIRNEAKPLFQSILNLKTAQSKPIVIVPVPEPRLTGLKDSSDIKLEPEQSSKSLNQENHGSDKSSGMRVPQWLGIGLALAGISAGVYGILKENEFKNLLKEYHNATTVEDVQKKRNDSQDAEKQRNIGYIVGSALLAGGITIYFVF
ncbi:MAG: hypothetical protein LBH25_14190 [Fibromonadaceae bacterium]|jgi:TolB-like protein|nr:hypothetical protein [Fibromonadaceae bacterium]